MGTSSSRNKPLEITVTPATPCQSRNHGPTGTDNQHKAKAGNDSAHEDTTASNQPYESDWLQERQRNDEMQAELLRLKMTVNHQGNETAQLQSTLALLRSQLCRQERQTHELLEEILQQRKAADDGAAAHNMTQHKLTVRHHPHDNPVTEVDNYIASQLVIIFTRFCRDMQ